jgi:energy-coupling factor transporter ATP-binding protein EcfA2
MEGCFDFSLREGSSMGVSGPTRCGKSTFVHAVLGDKSMFSVPPDKVYWFYGQVTDDLKTKDYILKEGLPESFADIPTNSVIVLDDLMQEAKDHPGVTNLFTKLVHHKSLFVINITQNFFLRTNDTRTRRLNSQYLVLFKNPPTPLRLQSLADKCIPRTQIFYPMSTVR